MYDAIFCFQIAFVASYYFKNISHLLPVNDTKLWVEWKYNLINECFAFHCLCILHVVLVLDAFQSIFLTLSVSYLQSSLLWSAAYITTVVQATCQRMWPSSSHCHHKQWREKFSVCLLISSELYVPSKTLFCLSIWSWVLISLFHINILQTWTRIWFLEWRWMYDSNI